MKTHVVVFTLFAVTLSVNGDVQDDMHLQKKIQECFDETNVPPDLRNANPTDSLDNPKLKFFNACMMKKKGTMKNGKIDPETQLVAMHPDSYDTIKEVVNVCTMTANQETDECEIAHSYAKCLIKNVSIYQC